MKRLLLLTVCGAFASIASAHEVRPAYLERSFHTLEMRWPRWPLALPSYTVGGLGAYWTMQRTVMMFQ